MSDATDTPAALSERSKLLESLASVALEALVEDFRSCPVSLLAEGHSKVVVAEDWLRKGYSLIEGTNRGGSGTCLTFDGRSVADRLVDLPRIQDSSPDLRVRADPPVFCLLKTRSCLGSLKGLNTDKIDADLSAVESGDADLFFLAADRNRYEALCGLGSDGRGMKSNFVFDHIFPQVQLRGFESEAKWSRREKWLWMLRQERAFGQSGAFLALTKTT